MQNELAVDNAQLSFWFRTAQRIFDRLRDKEGFSGGYAIVREYVARALLCSREMFVPLSHRPGQAQADFGQADSYIAGKEVRFHYFCADLPHSDGCFVKAPRLGSGAVLRANPPEERGALGSELADAIALRKTLGQRS